MKKVVWVAAGLVGLGLILALVLCQGKQMNINPDMEIEEGEEMLEPEIETIEMVIDGTRYEVEPVASETWEDVIVMRPLELTLQRYAEHEYYANLPEVPRAGRDLTSKLLAGHLYYWPEGNALVVNFGEYDIAPYKSVHLGEVKGVVEYLRGAGERVEMKF